jgi:hypothetical protein
MAQKTYSQLTAELSAKIRTGGSGGLTRAQDVRDLMLDILDTIFGLNTTATQGLADKADDDDVMHLSGDLGETADGVKTFDEAQATNFLLKSKTLAVSKRTGMLEFDGTDLWFTVGSVRSKIMNKATADTLYAAISHTHTADEITDLSDAFDSYFATAIASVNASIATKADKSITINGHNLAANITLVKADIGLGNADNTSDANKPVSTAQQTALNLKEDKANKKIDLTSPNDTNYPTTAATNTGIQAAVTALLGGVATPGNTLKKLYDLILGEFSEISVADIAARDALDIDHLPTNVFVEDDGDGKWALYKATTTGVGATFIKLTDQDTLSGAMSASAIKVAYESNADTNAFTDTLKAKLIALLGLPAGGTTGQTIAKASGTDGDFEFVDPIVLDEETFQGDGTSGTPYKIVVTQDDDPDGPSLVAGVLNIPPPEAVGGNIYTEDGTLTDDRQVTIGNKSLELEATDGANSMSSTISAAGIDNVVDDGHTSSEISQSAGQTSLSSVEEATGNVAEINTVATEGGNTGFAMTSQEGESGNSRGISSAVGPSTSPGIIISDTVDNMGFVGADLFPVSEDPKQYAQMGNIPGGSGTPLISKTYAQLATMVDAGTLVPGQQYLLTDYRTLWVQPVSGEVHNAADVEPLILTAVTVTKFSNEVRSTIKPTDIIRYDFAKNLAITDTGGDHLFNFNFKLLDTLDLTEDDITVEPGLYLTYADGTPADPDGGLLFSAGGIASSPGDGGLHSLDMENGPFRLILINKYSGAGFKVKVNNTVYDVAAYDNTGVDYIDIEPLAILDTIGSIQAYLPATDEPDIIDIEDDSDGNPSGTDRTGWITYREDEFHNSAFFDWRTVDFRRYKIDMSDTDTYPIWATGGSYDAHSIVQDGGGNVYGLAFAVVDDPNDHIDTGDNGAYVLLFSADDYIAYNEAPTIWGNSFAANTAESQDFKAFPDGIQGCRIGLGGGLYADNLPNVVFTNESGQNSEVADGSTDIHIDSSTDIKIGPDCQSLLIIGSSYLNIGSSCTQNFFNQANGVSLFAVISYCSLIHVTGVSVGYGSQFIYTNEVTQLTVGPSSSNIAVTHSIDIRVGTTLSVLIVNSSRIEAEDDTNNTSIFNSIWVELGKSVTNTTIKDSSYVKIAAGGDTNTITEGSEQISLGQNNKNNTIRAAMDVLFGDNCTGNIIGDPDDVDNNGIMSEITLGLNCEGNTIKGSAGSFGEEFSLDNRCTDNIIISCNNISLGQSCSANEFTNVDFVACILSNSQNTINGGTDGGAYIKFDVSASNHTVGNNSEAGGNFNNINFGINTKGSEVDDNTSCIEFGPAANYYHVPDGTNHCLFYEGTGSSGSLQEVSGTSVYPWT